MSPALSEARIQYTDNGDGSAEFTVSVNDEDHKFSAYSKDGKGVVEYEETLSWRADIRVSEPNDDIYKALMVSGKMTEFLEAYGLNGVRRE